MAITRLAEIAALYEAAKEELPPEHLPLDINLVTTYSDLTWLSQLINAARGPRAFHFVLEQAECFLDLNSQFETLTYLVNIAKKNQEAYPGISDLLKLIFSLALQNFHLLTTPHEKIHATFNQLMALFRDYQEKEVKPFEDARGVLMHLFLNSTPKENIFTIASQRFDEIYGCAKSPIKTIILLKAILKERKDDLDIRMHKYHTQMWNRIAVIVVKSVQNRNQPNFPRAQHNKDGSISFFIAQFSEIKNNYSADLEEHHAILEKEKSQQFERTLQQEAFLALLTQQYTALTGLTPHTSLVEKVDTKTETTGVAEYKIKLSPLELDSLLKKHSDMYAYRGEDNVLKLIKQAPLKEGVIRLAPVQLLDEKSCVYRAAGCQIFEMPTVQLRQRLPGYDPNAPTHFHWIPEEVAMQLSLNRDDVNNLLNKLLRDQQMLEGNRTYFRRLDGDLILSLINTTPTSAVKIVAMDDDSALFYSMYGNCGIDELKTYKSLEVSLLSFLQAIKRQIDQHRLALPDDQRLVNSARLIDTLIKTEKDKLQKSTITSPYTFYYRNNRVITVRVTTEERKKPVRRCNTL